MKSVLYLGCPSVERADTEKILATANVSVIWADTVAFALNELQRRDIQTSISNLTQVEVANGITDNALVALASTNSKPLREGTAVRGVR